MLWDSSKGRVPEACRTEVSLSGAKILRARGQQSNLASLFANGKRKGRKNLVIRVNLATGILVTLFLSFADDG